MYFNIIASGSKGNCTVVVSHKTVILIDMGITFKRLEEGMSEIGLTPDEIDGAIFTHNHTDHINGLKFIPIKKQYAREGAIPSSNFNVVYLNKTFKIGDFKITPIETSHDAPNPCGYIIEDDEEKLVYVTDTGMFIEDNIPLCKNPDYLILECNHDIKMLMKSNRPMDLKNRIMSDHGHLNNEDSALAAKDIIGDKTKEIILAHISEECNTPAVALAAYDKVFSFFGLDISKYNVRVANQWESLLGGNYEH